MPSEGPAYFGTVIGGSQWINPEFAEGAPDGNHADYNAGSDPEWWLTLSNWQGSLPAGNYIIPAQTAIEAYCNSFAQTINITTQLMVDGATYGLAAAKSVAIDNTNQWLSIADGTWDLSGLLPITTSQSFGFRVHFPAIINQVHIDSVRMTVYFATTGPELYPLSVNQPRHRRFRAWPTVQTFDANITPDAESALDINSRVMIWNP